MSDVASQDARGASLRADLDPRVNFAMQQNNVPVVKAVHIENRSGQPFRDLRLRITTHPSFAEPWETRIDVVADQTIYTVDAVDVLLSPGYLDELTERVRGHLRLELLQGDQLLIERTELVDVLARDEWGGLSSLPEILAAFVLPNYPAVQSVLRDAADLLGQWTGDPSLSGYQTKDPKRAYAMAAAIYGALQRLDLSYINPPASFEMEGQRIRLPDQIIESRMGTCLDFAVLVAGCLEQTGLHPLVILLKGHAFVAAWLHEESFPEPATDDPLRLRKRVDLNEIVAFDPTCISSRPSPNFEGAVQVANRHLARPEDFRCVIDIRRSRAARIRPLPQRVERTALPSSAPTQATGPPMAPLVPDLNLPPVRTPPGEDVVVETAGSRLDRWRRRLLDLSLRNRLLNFRDTKKTIPLLCRELAGVEDALAEGAVFEVLPRPAEFASSDPRDADLYRRRTGEDGVSAFLRDELLARRLHADLGREELDRRLLEVYRASRLELEEGGASSLCLALGFLVWYETPQSTQARIAPILLLPLEVQRRSVREGFTLRRGDDEPQINVTLLELLKQDHGVSVAGVDPLPEDDSGLAVSKILRAFREAVRDIDRWDVLDSARVGIFSFAKFLMWRDLNVRTADLLKNRVVEHLVKRPDYEFDADGKFPEEDQLDETRSPLQCFCPHPADASQLAAVFAAADGRSLVLEGPPGTGKSQTITNLIAHCLAEGRTVLFVSEKMAALRVVYERLQKVGLGPYCLELHSNKAHKQQVLAQLGEALASTGTMAADDWEREARQVERLRNELNAYVHALGKRRRSGDTVFKATSMLIGLSDAPRVPLRWPSPDALNAEQLDTLRDLVEKVARAAGAIGNVGSHPWTAVRRTDWTPAWQQDVSEAIDQLSTCVGELRQCGAGVRGIRPLQGDDAGWSLDEIDLVDDIARALIDAATLPKTLLTQSRWEDVATQIGIWAARGRQRNLLRAQLFQRFDESILKLDTDALGQMLEQASTSRWPVSWWRRRKLRKLLEPVTLDKNAVGSQAALTESIGQARSLRDESDFITGASEVAGRLLGNVWNDGEPDWDAVERLRDRAEPLYGLAKRIARQDETVASDLRRAWASLEAKSDSLLDPAGHLGGRLTAFRLALVKFREAKTHLTSLLDLDVDRAWGTAAEADILGRAERTLAGWGDRMPQLREWCAWNRARAEAMANNLAPLIEAYERGTFPSSDLPRAFEKSYYWWWQTAVVSAEPVLSQFFSPEHERKIDHFRKVDDRYVEMTRRLIAARLAKRIPASGSADLPNSEVGILNREIRKKRRHMPVRRLFGAVPNLLPRLKPCLLMSPMSVAQYLDAGHPAFDLVVFDEASQIPVWDAVGAIARGSQAVIVGDPKQLPPTNFFERAESDEDDADPADVVEDLESILDDCLSARLPQRSLHWHYRSRHESLIAFSNYHYYGNQLLTFPSPHREGMGVSWCHVPEGVYDRGKSATNRAEADAIVAEIARRLKDPEQRRWSIGVVTFSQAQQTLVEDLLEQVRRDDPEIDASFSDEANEPVFVKNLENVQGDERDVILFSICYGPDAQGRVSMNFGPMNRDGGERRLNVAITRARREVRVFSTLRADQIVLARTRARGVRDLKNFLEYAERGPSAIAAATRFDSDADFDSPFEKTVCDVLTSKGWEVHQQVGCARYRIDLAVVDPRAPGRYLLGIECDGANYHRAKTARDRDKLREGILRDLGWQLHRIWSTDWWANSEREIHKLEAAIEAATRRPETAPPPAASATRIASASPPAGVAHVAREAELATRLSVYSPLRVSQGIGRREEFYDPSSSQRIRELISEVVKHEAPISLRLVARRVAAHWGLERIHDKAIAHVERHVPQSSVLVQHSFQGTFLWPPSVNRDAYEGFRVSGTDPSSVRDPEDLPVEEVANAAHFLLQQSISTPVDDLIREVARLFGFQRTGRTVEQRMALGVEWLVGRGVALREGDRIALRVK